MDLMFEDEVDEVGSDVEAYCAKCKADTTHVVISKYEDEIRRVQCNPCGDVHSFRKPRGEVEDDVPEPVAARKRALLKKPTWEEFFAKHDERKAAPYGFRSSYKEHVMVTHPKFGVGFVSEVVSDSKVEITFKDGRRILVHNRRDIPGLPPEGDGAPTKMAAGKAKASKAPVKDVAKPSEAGAKKVAGKPEKPAKPAPKMETRKAPETKKPDKKPEGKKPESKKPESKKPEPKKAAPAKKPQPAAKAKTAPAKAAKKAAPAPARKPAKPVKVAGKPAAKKTAARPAARKPAPKKSGNKAAAKRK